jgi:hypothetical protein
MVAINSVGSGMHRPGGIVLVRPAAKTESRRFRLSFLGSGLDRGEFGDKGGSYGPL